MTDEADLELARECAAEVTAGHVAAFSSDAIRAGKWDGHITVCSALLAIKAERERRDAQMVVWLRAPSNRARTAVSLADAIERGEHDQ